jgi:omega-hydroxy-beta-dihydromenaquinone-9 sulfotransferase
MAVASEPKPKTRPKFGQGWDLSPHFWTGMNAGGWLRFLAKNRFAVGWQYWHIALAITWWSLINTLWGWWQFIYVGHRARHTPIPEQPLFVLGHWRSGTTLLHEMMVLDDRHTSPSTWACLAPNHFLVSENFARRFLAFLLPTHRWMDNMPTGWERPQEDEFALANLGLPSPYLTIAFPNEPPQYPEYLGLDIPPEELDCWKQGLWKFLRHITFRTPKRIVLKSPPHTARIKPLLEMFPDARFVHIVRDPAAIFSSTMNLWRKLYVRHGLQKPRFDGLDEYVFSTFERMYDRLERDRHLVPANRFCELRYEDLVNDPVGSVRMVYETLELGGFDKLLPRLERYLAQMEGYQTNRYELSPELRSQVAARWGKYMKRFGYEST